MNKFLIWVNVLKNELRQSLDWRFVLKNKQISSENVLKN